MDENKALDFFRNNNIYSLAYDSSITYYKNAGAAFFPYNIEGLGKKARKLIKDSEVGFDTDNDADENSIYECYEKNILEIIRFFKDTRDNFNNILQNEGNFNDNDDIKQIVNHLVEVNERAVNEYGDIITTTNITNDSVNETLLNNNINDNVLDNKQKSIPDEESKLIIEKDDEEKENLKNKINELEEKLSEEKKSNEINIKKNEEDLIKTKKENNFYQNENNRLNEQISNLINENRRLKNQNESLRKDLELEKIFKENKNLVQNCETQIYKNKNDTLQEQLRLEEQKKKNCKQNVIM